MNMECENCGAEPASEKCPKCAEQSPLWARFCPHCGAEMPKVEKAGDPYAIENRKLCRDENCIGIIGVDGRCVECHKPG